MWVSLVVIQTAIAQHVVGGSAVAQGDWQDAVAVYKGSTVQCTGVLVAPTVVLTAAHCVGGITAVRLGTNDYNKGGELIEVLRSARHPNSSNTYDIAALILADAAPVPPRMIAQDCVLDTYLIDGADVSVVGFGATDSQGLKFTSTLMEGFTTVDDADCSDIESGCNVDVSPGGELGAGGSDKVDSCFGDSGGPLYLLTPKGDYLVGITARGYNGNGPPCGQGGIYVRPDAVFDWIEAEGGVLLDTPDCTPNSPPVPTADIIEVEPGEVGTGRVYANDPDLDDTHQYTVVEEPVHGQVSIGADAIVEYVAFANRIGEDAFVVEVIDDHGGTAEVTVDVRIGMVPVNGSNLAGGEIACGCSAGTRHRPVMGWAILFVSVGLMRRRVT